MLGPYSHCARASFDLRQSPRSPYFPDPARNGLAVSLSSRGPLNARDTLVAGLLNFKRRDRKKRELSYWPAAFDFASPRMSSINARGLANGLDICSTPRPPRTEAIGEGEIHHNRFHRSSVCFCPFHEPRRTRQMRPLPDFRKPRRH